MSSSIHHYEMCVVCFEADPSYLFKPCKHKCVCEDCAHKYTDSEKFTACPVCREEFHSIDFDESEPPELHQDHSHSDYENEDEQDELAMAIKLSLQESENAEELQIAEMLEIDRATRISIAEFQDAQQLEHKRLLYAIVEQVKDEARIVEREIRRTLPKCLSEAEFAAEETQLLMIQRLENICRCRRLNIEASRESRKNQDAKKQKPGEKHDSMGLPKMSYTGSVPRAADPELSRCNALDDSASSVTSDIVLRQVKSELNAAFSTLINTLTHQLAAPVPKWSPTVIFNEIISATFQKDSNPDCKLKIHGYMSLYFPTNLVADIDSVNMETFTFRLRSYDHLNFCGSQEPLHYGMKFDERSKASKGLDNSIFYFEGTSIVSVLKKMVRKNPRAPFHRVTIFNYEIKDPDTENVDPKFCPLTLSADWSDGDSGATKLLVKYECNPNILKVDALVFLRNIQISVEFEGDFTLTSSEPAAKRPNDLNGISWTIASLRGNASGELTATFTALSAGKYGKVKANFNCEGTTLSGVEIEVHEENTCPIRTIKRRFRSGNYICESKTES